MRRLVLSFASTVIVAFLLTSCAIRRGVVHNVKQGQTLWRIAQVYDVELNTLMEVNNISNVRHIEPGTRIVIPGVSDQRTVPASPQRRVNRGRSKEGTAGSSTSSNNENTTSPENNNTRSTSQSENPSDNNQNDQASESRSTPDPPSNNESAPEEAVYFDPVWPCEGRLASRFDKEAGPSKRGIRIHTTKGSTVRAADDGNIKLAGEWEKMPDLGKIVIIFHSNDFTTVYAHLKSVKVSEGSKIERGEPIGTVGRTGDVKQPMCYFEVRYKLEPRDPLIFLGESS
ncbi:MAG: peptidoglycan DD-metalloendopeptidase family protein [bacterium]